MELTGKVILITGCSSGVGLHLATQLAQEGAVVYASMRNLAKAGPLKELAPAVHLVQLDVQDEASVCAAVTQIEAEAGHIDILVNNAGFGSVRTLEQASSEQFAEIMDVNFHGVVRCIRAVLPGMRARQSTPGHRHIVSVSSVGGLVGQPLNEIYCAAKFALEGLVESMAIYMEPFFNIRMTLIEPAGIRTEFVNRVLTDLQKEAAPLQDVYGPVLAKYIGQIQKRGAFESSGQTPGQVAEVIVQSLKNDAPGLRTLTSAAAGQFVDEKIHADPDGTLLQARIRRDLLGIE